MVHAVLCISTQSVFLANRKARSTIRYRTRNSINVALTLAVTSVSRWCAIKRWYIIRSAFTINQFLSDQKRSIQTH